MRSLSFLQAGLARQPMHCQPLGLILPLLILICWQWLTGVLDREERLCPDSEEECCDQLAMPAWGLGGEKDSRHAIYSLSWPHWQGRLLMEGSKTKAKQN